MVLFGVQEGREIVRRTILSNLEINKMSPQFTAIFPDTGLGIPSLATEEAVLLSMRRGVSLC